MNVLPALIAALLGWIAGAVAAHGAEAVMNRRSLSAPRCPFCTEPYTWWQWSALLAFVTGQGRCRACGTPARSARLIGELTLAGAWGFLIATYGPTPRTLLAMLTVVPLAMIMVTDLETKRIPNLISLPATGAMLLLGTAFGPAFPMYAQAPWWSTLVGALVGFVVLRLLVWVGVAFFGEGALGEGDITLATYAGAVVGFPMILEALVLTFFLGGIGAAIVLISRRGSLRTAIPYGPFIILGCLITLIWGTDVATWFFN